MLNMLSPSYKRTTIQQIQPLIFVWYTCSIILITCIFLYCGINRDKFKATCKTTLNKQNFFYQNILILVGYNH